MTNNGMIILIELENCEAGFLAQKKYKEEELIRNYVSETHSAVGQFIGYLEPSKYDSESIIILCPEWQDDRRDLSDMDYKRLSALSDYWGLTPRNRITKAFLSATKLGDRYYLTIMPRTLLELLRQSKSESKNDLLK